MLAKVLSAAVWGRRRDARRGRGQLRPGQDGHRRRRPARHGGEGKPRRVYTAVMNSAFKFPLRPHHHQPRAGRREEGGPQLRPAHRPRSVGRLGTGQSQAPRPLLGRGELALTGEVRRSRERSPSRSPRASIARRASSCPPPTWPRAAVVEGLDVYPSVICARPRNSSAARARSRPVRVDPSSLLDEFDAVEHDFADVKGQEHVKRALEVAVAGGHNVLMIGPPGSGKSMLAKRLPGICPPLTLDEALEATRVHSVAGALPAGEGIVKRRPFRAPAPHDFRGRAGRRPRPIQVQAKSASRTTACFFSTSCLSSRRNALEVLRQPLEDGTVTISRAAGSMTFPAQFMLVAAMNPSPGSGRVRRRGARARLAGTKSAATSTRFPARSLTASTCTSRSPP